jgi:predicted metal-dependent hydrolase
MSNSFGPIIFEYKAKKYIGYLIISSGKNVRIKICYGTLLFSIPSNLVKRYSKTSSKEKILTLFSNDSEAIVDFVPLFTYYMEKLGIVKFLSKKSIKLSGIDYLCDEYVYMLGERKKVKYGYSLAEPGEFSVKNRDSLVRIYKEMALNYLTRRTQELAKVMEVPFEVRIGLSKANNYLGMNNIKLNRIIYNPALYAYQSDFSDAIIIHELAHCFAHGHGKDFYAIIQKYCPEYKEYSSYISSGMFNLEMVNSNE